jgi:hypothetical protein
VSLLNDNSQSTTVLTARQHGRANTRVVLRILGALSLVCCAAWVDVTWWRVDDKVIDIINQHVVNEIVGHELSQPPEKNLLGGLIPGLTGGAAATRPALPKPALDMSEAALRRRGAAFGWSLYGWYALVTIAAALMALAGTAALVGRFPGRRARIGGLALAVLALTALGAYTFLVLRWSQQSAGNWAAWPVWAPRWAVVLLVSACLGAGLLVTNGGRGLHWAAAFSVMCCALGTLAALWIATRYGGIHDPAINAGLYVRAFLLEMVYPVLVLLLLKLTREAGAPRLTGKPATHGA